MDKHKNELQTNFSILMKSINSEFIALIADKLQLQLKNSDVVNF